MDPSSLIDFSDTVLIKDHIIKKIENILITSSKISQNNILQKHQNRNKVLVPPPPPPPEDDDAKLKEEEKEEPVYHGDNIRGFLFKILEKKVSPLPKSIFF